MFQIFDDFLALLSHMNVSMNAEMNMWGALGKLGKTKNLILVGGDLW